MVASRGEFTDLGQLPGNDDLVTTPDGVWMVWAPSGSLGGDSVVGAQTMGRCRIGVSRCIAVPQD